jgi:hypothetical protein
MGAWLVHGEDGVDLNGGAKGQARAADGDPGMPSLGTKDIHDQIGSAVDHLWVVDEIRRGVDEAVQAQALHDAVEVAERSLGLSEDVEEADPRSGRARSSAFSRASISPAILPPICAQARAPAQRPSGKSRIAASVARRLLSRVAVGAKNPVPGACSED